MRLLLNFSFRVISAGFLQEAPRIKAGKKWLQSELNDDKLPEFLILMTMTPS